MPDTLEHLRALDQQMQNIENLLTQAVQATQEAADVITNQIPNGTAPSLVAALPNLRQALHTALDNHNTLTAEIRAAQQAAEQQAQNQENSESESEN
jgi:ABC-type transporter Mla subunit MlaD